MQRRATSFPHSLLATANPMIERGVYARSAMQDSSSRARLAAPEQRVNHGLQVRDELPSFADGMHTGARGARAPLIAASLFPVPFCLVLPVHLHHVFAQREAALVARVE